MVRGYPDYTKAIRIIDAFGYTDKIPVWEVAPWTVIYDPDQPTLTTKTWQAALADNTGRIRVVVDTLPSSWSPTGSIPVDLAKVLGAALSKTNPVNVRLSDGSVDIPLPTALDTGALKIREQNPITGFATQTTLALIAGYTDGIEALLGGGLPAALDGLSLKVKEQSPITDFATQTTLALISTAIALPTSIGTIADVTAAASATQLTGTSTPCKTVTVRALAANTGTIRVGDSNVSATRGRELSAKDAVDIVIDNVNKVYVFGNASDKVSVTYVA